MPCFTGKGTDSLPYHLRASKFKADRDVFLGGKTTGFCLNQTSGWFDCFRFSIFWLPKVLGIASVIFGTLATVEEAEGNESFARTERVTQGVLLLLTWLVELVLLSCAKMCALSKARQEYRTDGRSVGDTNRDNSGPCCACDTTWPLALFHIATPILGFVGFFTPDLSVSTRTVLTTLPPFLLFTAVGMTHEKIDAEIENIKGTKITRPSVDTDADGTEPACCWVCC